MSLPTPPSSSHRRDKAEENNFFELVTRSVTWIEEPEIHCLSTPLKTLTVCSKQRPSAKHSILKKSTTLLVPHAAKQRDCTPEPAEILRNEDYLARPLTQIISVEDPDCPASLANLIEGYNVLAARLRSAIAESTDGDSDWPLFQPLRQNTEPFVDAIVRDLGRVFVDPLSFCPVVEEEKSKCILPSPEKTPTRKKGGMTGEQAKYARDLCTTCHSVIRTLSVIFAVPRFYKFFDEKHLRQILAAVLAIPLSDELPTPNARKTCALAISLIQMQRLPSAVLQPAADRIAYALRRGLDGELGKEGKKGSATDGLKAICDLCEYLPEVFAPAFVPVVPSVLSNLLANTLTLRTQACHALNGLVLGLTSLTPSSAHSTVSRMVASFLTAPGTPSKQDSAKKTTEAAIVRTLKATMSQVNPDQAAQGPVWALSVIASFVVLLNSRLSINQKINHTLCNLLASGMRHKKSSIRALTCLAWRCLSWAYLQPPLPADSEGESEADEESEVQSKVTKRTQSKIMMSVVECQTGVANIAALLGDQASKTSEEPLRVSLELLKLMAVKSGHPCYDATQTMMQMVSVINGESDEQDPWDRNLLLPRSLFSASNGLFTTEYKNLTQVIRPLFENLASIGDVRPLTREELTRDWVLAGLMAVWKSALGHLELSDEADMPPELITTWASLLKVNVEHLKDIDDPSSMSSLGMTYVKYVTDILENPDLNLKPNGDLKGVGPANRNDAVPDSDGVTPVIAGSTKCTNGELRLRVVRRMWNAMSGVFPKLALVEAAETLLACLMRNAKSLLTESAYSLEDEGERERNSWVALCVDVSRICGSEALRVFWGCEEGAPVKKVPGAWAWDWTKEFTNAVWKTAVEKWGDNEGHWEGAAILLGVPFTDKHAWNLTGEDFNIWEEFLGYATGDALDHGVDSPTVLDGISSFVSSFQTPGAQPYLSIRLADLLLSHLDISEMRVVPQNLVELASDTMRANYPPDTKNKAVTRWLARSLTTLVDKCPREFCLQILQALEDGVALWLADGCSAWEEDVLNYDMIPLYQHILVSIQGLADPLKALSAVGDIVGSVFSHRTPGLAVESFVEFWTTTCVNLAAPVEGWPESISRALRAVGLLPKDVTPRKLVSLSPALDLSPSPRTPTSSSYSTPSLFDSERGVSWIASPRRPRKAFSRFPAMPTSPLSPTIRLKQKRSTSATTPRAALSEIQICGEPSRKRRRLSSDGKENAGIYDKPLVSVAERIAEILKTNGTVHKKRKLESQDDEEDTRESPASSCASTPSKKLKDRMKPKRTKLVSEPVPTSPGSDSEELEWVEQALMPSTLPFPSSAKDVEMPSVPTFNKPIVQCSLFSGTSQFRRIDLSEMQKSRNAARRSSSTPEALWNAIESRKRKLSASHVPRSTLDENPGLGKVARRRYHAVPMMRRASMPERECLDSDSTVVEVPLTSRCGVKKAKEEGMIGSDDSLPASDDTVTGGGGSSSSEDDSPIKAAVSRHLQRTAGLGSTYLRHVSL